MRTSINLKLLKNNKLEKEYNSINAIKKDDSYSFIIENIKMCISNKLFTRENNEFSFRLDIEKKECLYLLKEKNLTFDIKVEKIILNNEKALELIYKIETDEEEFKIILEEIGE